MTNDSMISEILDDPTTGELTVTLTEQGRQALADLLDMVTFPAPTDAVDECEAERVRVLLEELRRQH